MIKFNLLGRTCILGFVERKFMFHCVTAERIKTFKDLVFRTHPTDIRKKMAKAFFKNGYSVDIVPVVSYGHNYYDVTIFHEGKPIRENSSLRYLTASFCSADTVSAILEYYQRR